MNRFDDGEESDAHHPHTALTTYRAMFDVEHDEAVDELARPAVALFSSGMIAGMCAGVSVLLLGMIVGAYGGVIGEPLQRLLFGCAYAVGFIIAIMGRTDLYTEYTTIAIFPVLTGERGVGMLLRLWGLVLGGNLAGGFLLALFITTMAPALRIADHDDFVRFAVYLGAYPLGVIAMSAVLAGWLMGLLSWLIAGGRDSTSQFLFILVIGVTIGALGLHHSVTTSIALFAGMISDSPMGWLRAGSVFAAIVIGNAIGGLIFAVLVREGVKLDVRAGRERDR
ncbi:formate/nitrite transporter family protein [Saliniramus sp.]|uniref:formate/nitrite transporter family protein n=1 Tax=Saliniramus sp. TaxID=2986772 RepID=UPI002B60C7D5|nr:formate/nitrite transporter family protein [Saliniramus sp.]HMB12351.1 formate/nitrite transporter family protein [Saliniramus sp.]